MKVEELLQQIRNEAEDRDEYALAVWCVEDVLGKAKEMGVKLTRDEAKEVISSIGRHQDCELGITWMTLECTIDEIKSRRDGG